MWINTQTQNINNTNDPQKKYRLGTVSKNILLEGLNQFKPTEPYDLSAKTLGTAVSK